MVNWGSNCINPRQMTKEQKVPKSEVQINITLNQKFRVNKGCNWRKIKSLRLIKGVIEEKKEARRLNWTLAKIPNSRLNAVILHKKKRTIWNVVWSLFIVFLVFARKSYLNDKFLRTFIASYVHQIWQHLHVNDHLTFIYNLMWSVHADGHHRGCGIGLKWPTQAALICQI
jgi:hypothetical protein